MKITWTSIAWLTVLLGLQPLSGLPRCSAQTQAALTSVAKPADSTILARVNGQAITESDLQFFVKSRKLNADDIAERREVLIERLIERQLLRSFLAQKKVKADVRLLDEHLTRIKLRLKEQDQDFAQVIAKLGFTEDSLRRELSLPLDWDAYVKQIVTDDKIKDVWKQRRFEFDGSEVHAAHIVLKSNQPEQDDKKLRDVREQILAKKLTFNEAAKKHSQSPSRDHGGDLGRFGFRGKQPVSFTQVAFRLKVGEVSEPFRTPFGVHLLTVTQRIDGDLSLEDARPEIMQVLSDELQQDVLKRERAKAKIERPQ